MREYYGFLILFNGTECSKTHLLRHHTQEEIDACLELGYIVQTRKQADGAGLWNHTGRKELQEKLIHISNNVKGAVAQGMICSPQSSVDGELFESPTVTFDYDFSQRHILVVSDDCTVKNEIKVVFNTKEQADGFKGMCFSWE